MATYRIRADITEWAPSRFFVTVAAFPVHEPNEERTGGIESADCGTLEEAQTLRDELVRALGRKLRARGHVILNVIDKHNRSTDNAS